MEKKMKELKLVELAQVSGGIWPNGADYPSVSGTDAERWEEIRGQLASDLPEMRQYWDVTL
jgi:hypothetical protein